AAVQLALRAGAEVFATAGSPEKREFLRRLGVAHVMDSRTLDFAEQVLEATGGRGVDVVLNSLAGEFIPRSLAALAEEGRFLEIGKRGIWTAEQVAEVKPRARYEVIDLGAYAQARPSAIRGMFERLLPWFEDATLRPLPTRVFDAVEAAGAFRYMAQAKHIGKIVVRQLHGAGGPPFDPDAAYLITGGGGGLGLEVGRWLVKRGAGCVVLTGRSAPSATVAGAIRELEDAGARVEFVRADITRPEDVDRLLEHVRATGRPLRGVIHAAAVLDDGLLLDQDWSRFERVLAPKMVGGWLLHERTRGMPLDFFVLFSSAVSLLGSG